MQISMLGCLEYHNMSMHHVIGPEVATWAISTRTAQAHSDVHPGEHRNRPVR